MATEVTWPQKKWYHVEDWFTRVDEQLDVIGQLLQEMLVYLRTIATAVSRLPSVPPRREQPIVLPSIPPTREQVIVKTAPPPVYFENVNKIQLKQGDVYKYTIPSNKVILITSSDADILISFDRDPRMGYEGFPIFARTYLTVYPTRHKELYIQALGDTKVYIMYGKLVT